MDNIPGNYSLYLETVPSMYAVTVSAAKNVPNPNEKELKRGRKTVYDTWRNEFPGNLPWNTQIPRIPPPKGGSDHKNFLQYAGIPVVNFKYQNRNGHGYPLYHTMHETMFLVEKV